ncbi:MAG: hypothetical protein F9K29_16850 [Hyphomicrobiaceae bacterium]|nr:MAG: hypothetical protein F9K29_16850 [Hyphomicrobiaceae bacterium]
MTDVSAAAKKAPAPVAVPLKAGQEVRIFQHSNLLYWWIVWFYGFICAGLTYMYGIGIKELAGTAAPDKTVLYYPSPWLGTSFLALLVFVIMFTNIKARGVYSFVVLMLIGFAAGIIQYTLGWERVFTWMPLLRIHLNLAFYLTFSITLLAVWLIGIFLIDRFTYWRFVPGQFIEEHRLGQGLGQTYNTEGMVIRRLPDDLFRHKILGLRFLGLGTGDLVVKPAHADAVQLDNVWHASKKQRAGERMIATRIMGT